MLNVRKMLNKQAYNINKKYYDKCSCKFAFCESCYWFATILVNKFNNINHCDICKKKDIHIETILS